MAASLVWTTLIPIFSFSQESNFLSLVSVSKPKISSTLCFFKVLADEHQGQGAARNLGLSKAKSDYIASLDSDDIWHKNFLTESVTFLEKHNLDFVFSNWVTNKVTGTSTSVWERSGNWKKYMKHRDGEWYLLKPSQVRRLFLETCPAPSSSLLIKRDALISGWNEEMLIADDWCLILEMVLSRYCNAAFTTCPFWTKNIHNGNIYDGRELIKIIQELGLHDEALIASMFDSTLSFVEKRILRKRLAGHHLDFGRLNWKQYGLSKYVVQFIATSVLLSPIGIFPCLPPGLTGAYRVLPAHGLCPIKADRKSSKL